MSRLLRYACGALLAASMSACGPTAKEKQVMSELTSRMKPVCMGRFVMEVPEGMRFGGHVTLYYGLGINFKKVEAFIESHDARPESMREQMDARARTIDQGDKNWRTKRSMLLEYRPVNEHMIYLRKQGDLISAAGSDHELHVLVGKAQLVLKADSYEGVPEAGRYSPGGKVETPEQVAARLFKIAGQIRPYDDPHKAGPGFCLGPAVIDSDNDEETASIGFRMDQYPDLGLRIYSKALTPDGSDKTLLERAAQVESQFSVDVLRKGNVALADMAAQEWLTTGSDKHDNLTLLFRVESMRADPSFVRPLISIKLKTGGQLTGGPGEGKYVASSLTPREAIALWDAIVSSIRVRPNAVRPAASPDVTKS